MGGGEKHIESQERRDQGDARRGNWMSKGGCHEGVSGHGCQEDDRRRMSGGGVRRWVSGGGIRGRGSGGGDQKGV